MPKTSILARMALATTIGGVLSAAVLPGAVAAAPSLRAQSWYLDTLHAGAAQKISTGRGVTIAVLDTGVDPDVPELAGRVVAGYDPAGGDGRRDDVGHGTAVASLAAGAGGGADRILGIAPAASVMPVRISPRDNPADIPAATLEPAVRWAVDHGARVVAMPFTSHDTDPSAAWKRNLVRYATDHGAVLVAAAGNTPQYASIGVPASIPGVVAVTGLGRDGAGWTGSVTGTGAAVAAPAQDIPVATGQRAAPYERGSGTSMATALVAGELALIMARYPKISAPDAINQLITTAHDAGATGRDPIYGYGVADPLAALTRTVRHVAANPLAAARAATGVTPGGATGSASPSAPATGPLGLSTAVLVAIVVVVALLVIVLVVVIITLRSRRDGGDNDGGGGGGGGGGPDGPPGPGPGGGPAGYREPPPPRWERPTAPVIPTQPRAKQPVHSG